MMSGNQPPSTILIEFDTRNVASIAPKITMAGIVTPAGQCHRDTATRYSRIVVISIVPDTAMP